MSKKIIKGICLVATLLLFTMSMDAATANGVGKSEKKVWQDSDPNKENYFNNRRALVGPGCMINSLFDGVEVVSGTKDLQNISNDDLDDYATIYNPQNEAFLHSRTSRAISQNETYRRNTPYPPLKNRPAYAGIHIL